MTWWSSLRRTCSVSSLVLVALVVALPGWEAKAADWYLKGLLSETSLYNSNQQLKANSDGNVFGLLSTVNLDFGLRTPSFRIKAITGLSYNYYFGPGAMADDFGPSGLNERNGFDFTIAGNAEYKRNIGPNTYNLSGFVVPEPTEISELTDSGKVTFDATRWSFGWNGGIDHAVDPLNTLSLDAAQKWVRFVGSDSDEFTPYDSYSLAGIWKRRLSQRSDATVSAGIVQSTFGDSSGNTSTTYYASTGFAANLTKLLSVNASVGGQYTDSEDDGTLSGAIWNFGFDYVMKRTAIAFDASQSVAPSSLGDVQQTTALAVNINHKVSPRLNLGASYRIASSDQSPELLDSQLIGASANYAINSLTNLSLNGSYNMFRADDDENIMTLSATYGRELIERLRGELSYTFKYDDDSDEGVATSHAAYFRLSRPFDVFR